MSQKKAVVVGGLGLVGSAISRELIRRNFAVTVVDIHAEPCMEEITSGLSGSYDLEYHQGDIRNIDSLRKPFEKADQVYHLAGILGTDSMDDEIHHAVQTNIVGTLNVLNAALNCRRTGGYPVRVFNATKPQVWLNTYTITKTATEQFCNLFNHMYSAFMSVTQLRYFNAYGPFQHTHPVRKIVPTFVLQAIYDLPLEIYGDGNQVVDMIHVDDMAYLSVELTGKGYSKRILDCGSGVGLTVNEVARDINKILGRDPAKLTHLPMRRGETPGTVLVADEDDLKTIQQLVPGFQFRDWKTSLEETLDWYAQRPSAELDQAAKFFGWPVH